MKTKFTHLRVMVLVLILMGCSQAQQPDQTTIMLPMGYVANVQFSPFYVAKERGYFNEAGFDVNFDYRWETDGIQLVAAGEAPFSIASGDQVIQARSRGLPVKAIAAWYQKFPVAVISLQGTPLNAPEDLRGLRIGIPETFGASYIGLRALLSLGNLSENDIDLQTIGYTQLALLYADKIDAAVVYANNEPVILSQEDTAFNIIYVSDYADMVSAVLVSSDTFVKENPDATTAFVAAFLHGLQNVIQDPDGAFEVSMDYVDGLSENAEIQREVLDASIQIWRTAQPGFFTSQSWEYAQAVMLNAALIDTLLPVDQYYTNEFIP